MRHSWTYPMIRGVGTLLIVYTIMNDLEHLKNLISANINWSRGVKIGEAERVSGECSDAIWDTKWKRTHQIIILAMTCILPVVTNDKQVLRLLREKSGYDSWLNEGRYQKGRQWKKWIVHVLEYAISMNQKRHAVIAVGHLIRSQSGQGWHHLSDRKS